MYSKKLPYGIITYLKVLQLDIMLPIDAEYTVPAIKISAIYYGSITRICFKNIIVSCSTRIINTYQLILDSFS